jgi:PAS domain S-box-containing protein
MIYRTPAPPVQLLPEATGPTDRADRYLRCLLELGRDLACDAGAVELAACATRRIVEQCADVSLAAVYRVEPSGRRAVLHALAGAQPAVAALSAAVDLARPYAWPETGDAETADAASRAGVTALEPAPGARPIGWLRLDLVGPDTPARTLFMLGAAQALAAAFARAHEREHARVDADALARREEALSAFLGEVSNAIRTPLTLLLGPLAAAAERQPDGGLKMALRHGQRLRRLVDALLDLSLIDAGRVDPVLEPIDIAAMTRDVASLFHAAAALAGVVLTVDCPALPQAVWVDRRQWEQVVINLVGNAIKFTSRGAVRVSLRAQAGLMTLDVSDTGRGIEADRLPFVFERLHGTRDAEESGLGLALVRELVRLHGGDIEASSVAGQGSRFRVCIPMLGKPARAVPHRRVADLPVRTSRARPADALGWAAPPVSWAAVDAAAAAVPAMRERIVLFIEHRDLREYVTGLLRSHYRVQPLADAADALRAVGRRAPDLVLVDLGREAAAGLAFMRQLRACTRDSLVPTLLLTADASAPAHADAIEAGADDIVAMPFSAAELLARVGAHMQLSSERRALHRRLSDHNRELEAQVVRRTEALAASEAQFKAISNLVPDILWRTDARGRIEWRSEQWVRYTGSDTLVDGLDFVHPDDRAGTRAWLHRTIAGGRIAPHEFRLRRHDGVHRWFVARMSPLAAPAGAVERWFGSATDIERQQLARHALEAQVGERTAALARAAALQQELLHQLSRSQEDERRRIARELHDSLGQYLTALKLALGALAPALGDPRLRDLVGRLDALTTEVDRELDDIIAALRPVVLDELGLAGALPGIVADWSRQSGIAAEALVVQVGDERFEDESESTLYRVTQESLTNVVKHARARNVAVTLARRQDELHLTIEDDGVGFDVNRQGGGWGLRGMAERARSAGGLLQIESTPAGGTTVLVRLPCRPRGAAPPAAAG